MFAGKTDAAIAALHEHLAAWPRDAVVLSTAANPNGLIGASGRLGQKHAIAVLMDSLAPKYGDDPWFLAHHAMALSEDGQLAAARPKIERAVAMKPTTPMARMASPMSATRAASRTRPAPICPPGCRPIRATASSTAT